jgi:hypothetical protein
MAGDQEGKSLVIEATPTIDTSAYSVGDQLGGVMTFSTVADDTVKSGAILSIAIIDKIGQNSAIDIIFFNKNPTITSVDNAALDISDAEMADKAIAVARIDTSEYVSLNTNSISTIYQVGILLQPKKHHLDNHDGKNFYAIMRCNGTPTYTSTTDLTVKIGILLD